MFSDIYSTWKLSDLSHSEATSTWCELVNLSFAIGSQSAKYVIRLLLQAWYIMEGVFYTINPANYEIVPLCKFHSIRILKFE